MQLINPLAFYLISGVILLGALGTVGLKNIFHSALCLILTFIGAAALYLLLQAEFIAGVQVLIYVGAIAVLILFAVMLTRDLNAYASSLPARTGIKRGLLVIFLAFIISLLLINQPWEKPFFSGNILTLKDLGLNLLTTYAFPFEILSLVLLAALIGALVIAKKEQE
jgi:NADH-quinone oxidoreductase subunit J